MKTKQVLEEVLAERQKQDSKWGEQNHTPVEWIAILAEEFGEASKEALEHHFGAKWGYKRKPDHILIDYREELIQVAAVAVAMIESLDRNKRGSVCHCEGCPTNGHGPKPCPACYE